MTDLLIAGLACVAIVALLYANMCRNLMMIERRSYKTMRRLYDEAELHVGDLKSMLMTGNPITRQRTKDMN